MSSNVPAMQQTMVMIRFLRLLECCGCAAAAEELVAGADWVGVADTAAGEDEEEDEEEDEDADGVAVCCETAELISPTTETPSPMKSLRGFEVEEAACATAPAALDRANAAERRSCRCMMRFARLHDKDLK